MIKANKLSSKLSDRFKKREKQNEILAQTETVEKIASTENNAVLAKTFTSEKDIVPEKVIVSENNSATEKTAEMKLTDETSEINIKKALMRKIESIPVWFDYSVEKQRELISGFVVNKLLTEKKEIPEIERNKLVENLLIAISGFGPLDYLINQKNVSAIFVNGQSTVFIEIAGKVLNTEMKLSEKQLSFLLKNIANFAENKPGKNDFIWNCKVKDMWVTVVLPPVATNGANIIIKKLMNEEIDVNTLYNDEFLSKDIYEFILASINAKKNIIISGEINSGKTFFLNVLLKAVLDLKRGVILEEFSQMVIENENAIKFSLNAIKSEYDFNVLTASILKMSPEFVAIDLNNSNYFSSTIVNFSDLNGVITTLRASSVDTAIQKIITGFTLENKCTDKQAKASLLKAFDYIIHIDKFADGKKKVTSVIEIAPTKTSALSLKEIVKWENNRYITDIPQPLTSIKADVAFVNTPMGAMKARFYSSEV